MQLKSIAKSRFNCDPVGLEAELLVQMVGLRALICPGEPGEATHTVLRLGISDNVYFDEIQLYPKRVAPPYLSPVDVVTKEALEVYMTE